MADLDVAALAGQLRDTTANLQAHIDAAAERIALPRINAAQAEADARVAELERQHRQETQRAEHLVRELKRQLADVWRSYDRLATQQAAAEEATRG